jgi:hypothetical protein
VGHLHQHVINVCGNNLSIQDKMSADSTHDKISSFLLR